jgi:hypothetical protein
VVFPILKRLRGRGTFSLSISPQLLLLPVRVDYVYTKVVE